MASPRVRRLRKAARVATPAPVVTPEAQEVAAAPAPEPAPVIEEICEEDPCETEDCETHPEPKASKKSSKKVKKSSAKKAN